MPNKKEEEKPKNRPKFYGLITVGKYPNQEKIGKISMWKTRNTNPKQPKYEGRVEYKGEKALVAIWENQDQEETTS